MKNKEEIAKEIKRLKTQVTKIKKASYHSGFAAGVSNAFRIVVLESNISALKWVIDQENKLKLGFNLKTK